MVKKSRRILFIKQWPVVLAALIGVLVWVFNEWYKGILVNGIVYKFEIVEDNILLCKLKNLSNDQHFTGLEFEVYDAKARNKTFFNNGAVITAIAPAFQEHRIIERELDSQYQHSISFNIERMQPQDRFTIDIPFTGKLNDPILINDVNSSHGNAILLIENDVSTRFIDNKNKVYFFSILVIIILIAYYIYRLPKNYE